MERPTLAAKARLHGHPQSSQTSILSFGRRWDHRSPHCHVHQTDESVVLAVSCGGVSPEGACCCDEFHAESSSPPNPLSPVPARAPPPACAQGIDTAKPAMSLSPLLQI